MKIGVKAIGKCMAWRGDSLMKAAKSASKALEKRAEKHERTLSRNGRRHESVNGGVACRNKICEEMKENLKS
jgi:hypothetical protein